MDDLAQSNSLTDLAARIRAEHDGAKSAAKRGLAHAITAGELLIEAKAQLPDGQWRQWLGEHCDLPGRTARAYMRIARNKERLETENGSVANLSLRGALAAVSAHLPTDDDDDSAEWAAVMPKYEAARMALSAAADGIGCGPIENDLALVDIATLALDETLRVDELADVDDLDIAIRGYARRAKDEVPVSAATEIRLWMTRRLGQEMLLLGEQLHLAKPLSLDDLDAIIAAASDLINDRTPDNHPS